MYCVLELQIENIILEAESRLSINRFKKALRKYILWHSYEYFFSRLTNDVLLL